MRFPLPVAAMRRGIFLLTLEASFACANPLRAAVITNLDGQPQRVEVAAINDDFHSITIAPNETYRVPGELVVRYHGRVSHLDDNEEWAIWPDRATGGNLGPQMREKHANGILLQ